MLSPIIKLLPILNTVFQITYHRNVSKKNSTRSMTYMIASVNATWFRQRLLKKYLSEQPWIFIPTMTATGLLNASVR